MNDAKRLTFDRNVSCRTITLSGEDFRPTGVLTGGSRTQKASLLTDVAAISTVYEHFDAVERQIRDIDQEIRELQPIRNKYEKLRNNLFTSTKRLDSVVDNLKHSPVHVLTSEIQTIEAEISECEAMVIDTRPELDQLTLKIRNLEEQKKNEKFFHVIDFFKYPLFFHRHLL